jgi:hypothetical protein
MKLLALLLTFSLCTVLAGYSQNADTLPATPAGAEQANPDNKFQGATPTTLVKALDTKKLKAGDTVACQTTAALHSRSGLLVPTGTKVIGHVTQAEARSKGGSDSSLAIVFDKLQMSTGKTLPMKGVIQAVGPSLGSNEVATTATGGLGMGGGGMGGRGGTAANTATVAPPSNAVAGPNSGVHPLNPSGTIPILNAESQGVLGIKNLEMGKDSLLTSTNRELKLDTGTQIMIRAEVEMPVQ